MTEIIILTGAIFALAILYSSVGHAGASGYLAAMALLGMAPEEMKPTALTLNIFVAAIGTYRFAKAGHFSWSTLIPFAIAAIPLAFVGGRWPLPDEVYKPLVGVVLFAAAISLIIKGVRNLKRGEASEGMKEPKMPTLLISLPVGGALGLLAGLTGTGGGIFLSPLLLLCGWATPKRTAAVAVVFVGLNSVAGLAGHLSGFQHLPDQLPFYLIAAIAGGLIGSGLGAKKFPGEGVRIMLGVVLIIASAKMFMTINSSQMDNQPDSKILPGKVAE